MLKYMYLFEKILFDDIVLVSGASLLPYEIQIKCLFSIIKNRLGFNVNQILVFSHPKHIHIRLPVTLKILR